MYNDKMSVKVTNSMTLREVRDLVCDKRKVDPASHGLELNGKVLDLNLTAMTANLQQGTKVDLVKVAQEAQGFLSFNCSSSPSFVCAQLRLSPLFFLAGDLILVTLELETGGRMTERVKGALSLWDMLVYFQDQLKSPGKFTSPSTGRVVLFLQGKEVQTLQEGAPFVCRSFALQAYLFFLSLPFFPPFLARLS